MCATDATHHLHNIVITLKPQQNNCETIVKMTLKRHCNNMGVRLACDQPRPGRPQALVGVAPGPHPRGIQSAGPPPRASRAGIRTSPRGTAVQPAQQLSCPSGLGSSPRIGKLFRCIDSYMGSPMWAILCFLFLCGVFRGSVEFHSYVEVNPYE